MPAIQKLDTKPLQLIAEQLERRGDVLITYRFGSQTVDEQTTPRDADFAVLRPRWFTLAELLAYTESDQCREKQ